MPYSLIKSVHKEPSEAWMLWMNTVHSVSSEPDARDSTLVLTESEKQVIIDYINNVSKIQPGYQGWNRTYPGQDDLEVVYYFDTAENANNYRQAIRDPENPYYVTFRAVMDSKGIPPYQVSWTLIGPNGETLPYGV